MCLLAGATTPVRAAPGVANLTNVPEIRIAQETSTLLLNFASSVLGLVLLVNPFVAALARLLDAFQESCQHGLGGRHPEDGRELADAERALPGVEHDACPDGIFARASDLLSADPNGRVHLEEHIGVTHAATNVHDFLALNEALEALGHQKAFDCLGRDCEIVGHGHN